jgi:oxygen-independent coproporphyrinogen-3 oxidase
MAAVEPAVRHHPLSRTPAAPSRSARDAARLGLYLHVPFCAVRCAYCDFATGSLSSARLATWVDTLEREIALRAPDAAGRTFTSVFFGGGTPSALPARVFTRVARALRAAFAIAPDAEFTVEANPEGVRPALLEAWAGAGANRLSMGAQSFDAGELRTLGRIHGPERPAEALALARAHGFRRLSLDLMFAFPGHSEATWARTLDAALATGIDHLSAYAFIPEDGAPLGAAVRRGALAVPDGAAQARLYATLVRRARAAGLVRYETSNFARPGEEARHNLTYWLRRDHLALGPSAHGLWDGVRHMNHRALERWAAAIAAGRPGGELEPETRASRADEIVMLALRLDTGLDAADHDAAAWADVQARYGARLERGVAEGRLEARRRGWRIAPHRAFLADEIIAWLMAGARPLDEALAIDTPRSRSVTSVPCPISPFPAV